MREIAAVQGLMMIETDYSNNKLMSTLVARNIIHESFGGGGNSGHGVSPIGTNSEVAHSKPYLSHYTEKYWKETFYVFFHYESKKKRLKNKMMYAISWSSRMKKRSENYYKKKSIDHMER